MEGDTKEDIISSLPDCILLHILSFLPLRTCVMTSFLSSSWRDIWKHLEVIDLDDYFEDFERQAVFVNSAFLRIKSFKYLRKLRLTSCFREQRDSLTKWLGAVSGPKSHLKELDFWLYSLEEDSDDEKNDDEEDPDAYFFSLPPALFACTNLVKLRWRHIWKDLQVVDLLESFEDFESQAVFVNSAFRLSKSFKYLRKLSLSCLYRGGFCDTPAKWLGDVCGPQSHLEEIHFLIYDGINSVDEKFDENGYPEDRYFRSLPLSLFASTNLVKLSLARGIYLNLESISEVCLSSLKTLTIRWMLTDITSMNVLLAGCPVLEDLHITSLFLESSGGICVPSSLKRLRIELGYIEIDDDDDIDDIPWASLQINAPRLEYLELGDMNLDRVSNINNLQNVIKANLDLIEPYDDPFPLSPDNYTSTLIEFLHLLTGIQHLVLRLGTTQWLLSASGLNFPEYRYLRHLELNLPCFNSYLVFSLLEKCQVLQVLIIQNGWASTVHSNLPKWVQKTSVSNCLEYHLTTLHLKRFQGHEDEMRFAEYVLQKGLVLNTVNITSYLTEKLGILKRLSNMPKGSATCRLQFNGCASH